MDFHPEHDINYRIQYQLNGQSKEVQVYVKNNGKLKSKEKLNVAS